MPIKATIAEVRQETPTVRSFLLHLGGHRIDFKAGQWVDLYAQVGGQVGTGGYSITSSPLRLGSIELAVKLVGRNPVTWWLHRRARPGDTVYLEGGHGEFCYEQAMGDDLVLVGGGIGITPLMSILRYVDEGAPNTRALLLYSARHGEELLFRGQIEEIARRNRRLRCVFTVSGADPAWGGRRGRIDGALLEGAGAGREALYYVCGPPAMIESVGAQVAALGVPGERIRFERWW